LIQKKNYILLYKFEFYSMLYKKSNSTYLVIYANFVVIFRFNCSFNP